MTETSSKPITITISLPANEAERLEALRRYNILDTPAEAAFDRITSLAARLFDVPIALVSLVDASRAWFKSCYGFDLREVQRDATICSLALLYDDVLVIPDTRQDDRLTCNPFVQNEPGLRFYAGAPLLTQDGFNLGTLCLLDTKPRDALTDEQTATLADLAAMVVDELELRLAARKIAQLDAALLEVTQGVSAVTGEAFFSALVQHFTKALGSDYTYIGLLTGDDPEAITTIAACAQGQIIDNFEYLLQDTPCREVIRQQKMCCYPRGVQGLFPKAPLLEPLNVDSYVAIPFFDSAGKPLGLLGVMDGKPLENVQLAESLLTIFALRIATELERQQTEEIRTQTLIKEQQYSRQLHGLTQAALAINATLSVEEVLQVITEQAYQIIGTHQSVTSLSIDQNWAQAINAVYLSDKYAQWRDYDEKPDGSGIYACACHLNRPMRMTQAELQAHPKWNGFGEAADRHPPMRGWLVAPLVGRDGRNIGLIQLSDKYDGEFTEEDEAILVQLAQMASVAVENTRLYEAQQLARTQAESANRIKDEFLAVLSHELRSPLNPILGWAKLLRSRKLDEQKTAHALATIERNANLQTQLIGDLLDVSRILQGKLSLNIAPVDLASTITAAMETVRLAAQAKSIQIHTALNEAIGQVAGDGARLQQIIWNLLSNAVKFTPEGGRVEVRLERIGSQAQISVSDTGKGISPDFLPYVFDYFRQADGATTRKFGGLGLGLAIVRHLTELHGGIVTAESLGEGQGATFIVRLPLLKEAAGLDNEPSSNGSTDVLAASPLAGLSILVVDDDADTREYLTFVLEQAGANARSAESADEALQVLVQSTPDILLSDIGMPEMDGYMLMQQVRAMPCDRAGQIRSIALTAYAGQMNQQQAIAAGFQRHIAKPVLPETLIQEIRNMVSCIELANSKISLKL
jgi:signal transduction histidine kinase/ActR/RegA family two-component response regulator